MNRRLPWLTLLAQQLEPDTCRTCRGWPAVAMVNEERDAPPSHCPTCGLFRTQVMVLPGIDLDRL